MTTRPQKITFGEMRDIETARCGTAAPTPVLHRGNEQAYRAGAGTL
jgi:hypothetical protein